MEKLPQGGEALLIALQTPNDQGTIGIPVLIWGKPGEGKSSFLEDMATPDFPVLTLIASIHDPTDFSGLPIMHEGKVKYAIPEWVESFGEEGKGLLFLDELTTAPPSVQAALLRVVLERKVGFHDLPKKVRIVAAANPPDFMTGGWELTPPLRNRFVHLHWSLPPEVYRNSLSKGFEKAVLPIINPLDHEIAKEKYKALVDAFLRINPNLLTSTPDNDRYGFASPRSWDFSIALMASCEVLKKTPMHPNSSSVVFTELLSGCLGEGIATNFIGYLRTVKVPDPKDVLDGRVRVDLQTLNDSELFILFNGFLANLKKELSGHIFLQRSKVLMPLIDEVIYLQRKDIIFPAIRSLAKEEHLIARLVAAANNGDTERHQKIMSFVKHFFGEEGFEKYITLIG